MTDQPMFGPAPSKWGGDSLSLLFEKAHQNAFFIFDNRQEVFNLFREIHEIFLAVIEQELKKGYEFPQLFLSRTHAAYLAAVRLAISGQQPESNMCLRGSLENSLYAFFVHAEDAEGKLFLNKSSDEESRKKFIRQMRPSNILEALKKECPKIASFAKKLYDFTIDCGAHPNPLGVLAGIIIQKEEIGESIVTPYFNDDPQVFDLCLLNCYQTGVCALDIIKLVYPEAFSVSGVTDRLNQIRGRY